MWDESAFAVQSYEMLQNNSYIVSYFNGTPSVQSSKPPLQNWAQMLFIKLIGFGEVAVRLPSALAAATCIFLIFLVAAREVNTLFAWISSLVLLTSQGFIGWHTARTGDADAMLALGLLMQFIAVYYLFKSNLQTRWIWLFWFSFLFSFFTKSFAAAFFLPGFLVYALIFERKQTIHLARKWQSYVGLLLVCIIVIGYYWLRESLQPGYADYSLQVHAGRFSQAVGPHANPWDFYIMNYIRERYAWWSAFALLGIGLTFLANKINSRLFTLSAFTVLSMIAVLSLSVSKLLWYDNPTYPLLALLAALPLYLLFQLREFTAKKALIVLIFALPITHMFRSAQSNYPGVAERDFEIKEHFLFQLAKKGEDPKSLIVMSDAYVGGLLFYQHLFEERGQKIRITHDTEFEAGDRVLVMDDPFEKIISQRYQVDTLEVVRTALILKINGKRNVEDSES